MAVDCGDKIPSKSKMQPAGITSYTNPENLLSFYCFVFNFPNFRTLHCDFQKDSSFLLESSCICFVFQCSIVLLLVLTRPDDLCASFFFFLKGNSFASASTLSHTCSRAYPPRYCLQEISFPMELLAV